MKTPDEMARAYAKKHGYETFPTADRAMWLKRREADVTASVAGALFGAHPYVTAFELYHIKAGLVATTREETLRMRRGRLLEDDAITILREENPRWEIVAGETYFRDPMRRIGATPDAYALDPRRKGFGIIQIKTVDHSAFFRDWLLQGAASAPVIPTWIGVQAIVEAMLTGASWIAVVPLVGFDLKVQILPVDLNAEFWNALAQKIETFWGWIAAQTPPNPDYARDGEFISGLHVEDNGMRIDLSRDNRLPELLAQRAELKARIKADEEACDAINAEIKHKIGEYETAELPGWKLVYRTQTQHRPAVTFVSRPLRVTPVKAAPTTGDF